MGILEVGRLRAVSCRGLVVFRERGAHLSVTGSKELVFAKKTRKPPPQKKKSHHNTNQTFWKNRSILNMQDGECLTMSPKNRSSASLADFWRKNVEFKNLSPSITPSMMSSCDVDVWKTSSLNYRRQKTEERRKKKQERRKKKKEKKKKERKRNTQVGIGGTGN